MLFQIDVTIDYGTLRDHLDETLAEEWKRSEELHASGTMIGIWRKADASGVIALWRCVSLEELREKIAAMPLYPYFRSIVVTPLVAHPRFPQYATQVLGAGSAEG